WLRAMKAWPADAVRQLADWLPRTSRQPDHYRPLQWLPVHLSTVTRQLKAALADPAANDQPSQPAMAWELELVERLHRETAAANRNNVTRTNAYYELYRQFPELHWAFLAHMVSRNGGWSMTDLKGELLPKIVDAQKAEPLF